MYKQITKDLINKNNHLCYFISSDFITKEKVINDFVNIQYTREKINYDKSYPNCVLFDNIFSIVIKDKFYSKPTIYNICKALILLKQKCIENSINNICILITNDIVNNTSIDYVELIINKLFKETDINITTYLDDKR